MKFQQKAGFAGLPGPQHGSHTVSVGQPRLDSLQLGRPAYEQPTLGRNGTMSYEHLQLPYDLPQQAFNLNSRVLHFADDSRKVS